MKITIELPDRIFLGDTRIASTEEDRKGLKARLEKQWRATLRRRYIFFCSALKGRGCFARLTGAHTICQSLSVSIAAHRGRFALPLVSELNG